MKSVVEFFLKYKTLNYFICALMLFGGIMSFFTLGRLEDPTYTVKDAQIITRYPGASAEEVELEVTDRIEKSLQEMLELKEVKSISKPGESIITVKIQPKYWSKALPQIWDIMRKKVNNVIPDLPPGVEKPLIYDDFGQVYGFLLALTGEDYSYSELEDFADIIKKELSIIPNVTRVDLWGVQPRVVYLDFSEKQIAALELTAETILNTLKAQNIVVDSGHVDTEGNRFRLMTAGEFKSPEEIGELIIRPKAQDVIDIIAGDQRSEETAASLLKKANNQFIKIKDVATVRTGYLDPPKTLMRFDGQRAIGIQIAGSEESNIVEVGNALSIAVDHIVEKLPAGVFLHKIAWQSDVVDAAVNGFVVSLVEAILIVLVVLMIPSGIRMGAIIGVDLLLTILATFIFMAMLQIPFQRMSLGALIIALGMMVDNSIVVSDGIAVRIRQGMHPIKAAVESAANPAYPLFAATLVAVMAFFPIYLSPESTGEYCQTLFLVVAASLLISWFVALCITPLHCIDFLNAKKEENTKSGGEFDTPFYQKFRRLLVYLIDNSKLTLMVIAGVFVFSIFCFGFVKQMFFPDSTRPQLMVDFWMENSTRIENVSADTKRIEEKFFTDDTVESISTFIGAGPPRFYLPVEPEKPYPNYAQLIINFDSYASIDPFIDKFQSWTSQEFPDAMIRYRKFGVGPGNAWKFELRISGPGEADLKTLRELADKVKSIAEASPYGRDMRLDVMNPVINFDVEYDQKRGRLSSLTRPDVADALKRRFDGRAVGLYRQGRHLYPITVRNIDEERNNMLTQYPNIQVRPELSTKSIPLGQVIDGVGLEWDEAMINRWNRRRSITVQGDAARGVTFPTLKASIEKEIAKVPLPPGYQIFWAGEQESSSDAKKSLIPGIIPAVVLILLMIVSVFNSLRPVLLIILTLPLAIIGVTFGLLIFNVPFGFLALLGVMSLGGMMNKNIVVLLDACNDFIADGKDPYHAIIDATITRVRPVALAAMTTVLGVIPLLQDVFWVSMAVSIMAGLSVGTFITLLAVPVLYSVIYQVKKEKPDA